MPNYLYVIQFNINMLGLISMILFLHSGFSTLRWRKYVQANQEPFFLPIDIAIEVIIAVILAYIAILANTKKFKVIKEFNQIKSYDSSFFKPNFKNYRTSRATLLLPFLKERLGTQNFEINLKI